MRSSWWAAAALAAACKQPPPDPCPGIAAGMIRDLAALPAKQGEEPPRYDQLEPRLVAACREVKLSQRCVSESKTPRQSPACADELERFNRRLSGIK